MTTQKFDPNKLWERLEANLDRLSKTQQETSEQMKRTDEKLERIGIRFGNFQNNVGEEKEEMFYQYLDKNKKLNNIKFDEVNKNLNDGKREYDIVMKNGKYIAIVEVKLKAHVKDIDKLTTEQVTNFKKNFKLSDNKKIITAIASPVITDAVRHAAKAKGVAILTQNGDSVQEETVGKVVGF
jgi:Holliday junction resolvase-like predicted endonuclease